MNYGIWTDGELRYSNFFDNYLKRFFDVYQFIMMEEFSEIYEYIDKHKTIFVVSKGEFMYYANKKYDFGILYVKYDYGLHKIMLVSTHFYGEVTDDDYFILVSEKTTAKIADMLHNCESLDELVQFLTPNFDKYLKSLQNMVNDMSEALTLTDTKSAE